MIRWRALWLSAVISGCAAKPVAPTPNAPPAAPPPQPVAVPQRGDEPPAVRRWGELTEELATALERAGATGTVGEVCREVARTVQAFLKAHEPELRETHRALLAWEETAGGHAVRTFYKRIFPAMEVRIDAGIRCKDDRSASEAFDRFFVAAGLDLR